MHFVFVFTYKKEEEEEENIATLNDIIILPKAVGGSLKIRAH